MSAPVSARDAWVQRAIEAAVEQGFDVSIEDEAVLGLVAEMFSGQDKDDAVLDRVAITFVEKRRTPAES